ncbi:unnamed protein product, partial [Musa acuminata subsp. malaccensis]
VHPPTNDALPPAGYPSRDGAVNSQQAPVETKSRGADLSRALLGVAASRAGVAAAVWTCAAEEKQGRGCEDHGWATSSVGTSWAVAATVMATGVRSNKGTRDCGAAGNNGSKVSCLCSVSVTKDAEQGGAVVGIRAAVVAWWPAVVMGRLGGDDGGGEEECWRWRGCDQ